MSKIAILTFMHQGDVLIEKETHSKQMTNDIKQENQYSKLLSAHSRPQLSSIVKY